MIWRRRLGTATVALATVAALILLLRGTTPAVRAPAPALPSTVLQPPSRTLASLRGRPALIHFWASWCGPCNQEAPQIALAADELRGRAALVGVDFSDSASAARAFLRRHKWSFTVLSDPDGEAGNGYGLAGLPATFILDGRGRIVA